MSYFCPELPVCTADIIPSMVVMFEDAAVITSEMQQFQFISQDHIMKNETRQHIYYLANASRLA